MKLAPLIYDFSNFQKKITKTTIGFGFCDIQNNQGLGEGYQPQPSSLIISTSALVILDNTKPNLIIVLLYMERKKIITTVGGTDNLFLNV